MCLEDIELRRNDEHFLDSIGAERIPDPTTAGDFCRRFNSYHITRLQDAFDRVRLDIWKQQDDMYDPSTPDRARPENIKEQIVTERGYTNQRLASEWVTEVNGASAELEQIASCVQSLASIRA